MKWIGISGGWHLIDKKIKNDVRRVVAEIMQRGDGIVSGGAFNVDSIALDEAMRHDSFCERIKVFLPTTLSKYIENYHKYVELGDITENQAEALINQLTELKRINPVALIENPDTNFTEENKLKCYYEENSDIVAASDGLVAFWVKTKDSEGLGTVDTMEKAKIKGIPIDLHFYNLNL